MSETAWEDVVELPDEIDDDTAENLLEEATEIQDLTGEVCPYPQVKAKKAVQGLSAGEWLVRETDHVPSTENVPKAVGDLADTKVWKSANGFDRIFLHRR